MAESQIHLSFYNLRGFFGPSNIGNPQSHAQIVLLPIVIFLLFYRRRGDIYDFHHAILGLLFSILVTGVLTLSVAVAVGRPRPDFFWRCFPDGKDAYDQWGGVVCHGDTRVVRNGHKSLPSGHASWSFAGLGFLSLYLSGKIKVFDRRGHVTKLCAVLLPLFVASLVRVNDNQHHWQDVFNLFGSVHILLSAALPTSLSWWRTYTYLEILEELRTNTNNVQRSNAEVEIRSDQRDIDSSLSGPSILPVEDLESGRR
ncbi:hypothetical protein BUALT_Bualt11G0057300 [Buddleja alternifolia]|uniref:Phosphatidic acid phosphatase type 2/haloperoxidase domain-containing protein n=1 Tax=Buddleja alternifolia TaxID=168488 RepID=A0AAV6WUK5_9LAMI|nr:hypothetical protein BUALT_Bualt11G0057300 [Buddleja alternifolia]